jgi:hypothetical protein
MSVGYPTVRTYCGDSRDAEMLLSEACHVGADKPQLRLGRVTDARTCLDRFDLKGLISKFLEKSCNRTSQRGERSHNSNSFFTYGRPLLGSSFNNLFVNPNTCCLLKCSTFAVRLDRNPPPVYIECEVALPPSCCLFPCLSGMCSFLDISDEFRAHL